MLCAYCKINIDDDSSYCDQCGREILICPKCNNPGKGKMCTSDGTALVSMKTKTATAPVSTGVSAGVSLSNAPVAQIVDTGELHLINRTLGLDLKIEGVIVIGSTTGDFVGIFSKYQQISGKHLQINFDHQKGWFVTDLGSTNGTKYNNIPLKPMMPQILSDESYLCIANIEFFVQIVNATINTKTQRI